MVYNIKVWRPVFCGKSVREDASPTESASEMSSKNGNTLHRVIGIIQNRFLQTDFRQYIVKILTNPSGFVAFLPCLAKNLYCKK